MNPNSSVAVPPLPKPLARVLGPTETDVLGEIAAGIAEVVEKLDSAPGKHGQMVPVIPHSPPERR